MCSGCKLHDDGANSMARLLLSHADRDYKLDLECTHARVFVAHDTTTQHALDL